MNEIKQRLEEKYLKMEDYYNISFDVLKRIFKQNKMLIIIFILINMLMKIIAEKYQGFLKFLEITGAFDFTEVKNYWYSVNANIVLSAVLILVSLIILRKAGAIIEEDKGKFIQETVMKFFMLICTALALLIVFSVLLTVLWSAIFVIYFSFSGIEKLSLNNMKGISSINIFIYITIAISAIIFILQMLYFVQMYFLRRIGMYEALVYNFHLCKKNRLRIILPVALLVILNILLNLPFGILGFATLFSKYKFLIIIVASILNSILSIFFILLTTVVYLNVEYMDLRKK